MTTTEAPLTKAMRDGLRAFYFHTTDSFTGGEYGIVERLNEHGGTLHGWHRYTPGMRSTTMAALERRGLVIEHYDPRSAHGSQYFQLTPSGTAILHNLLTAAELVEIDTYWQEQALAEDLIRDQLATEVAQPGDLSRTDERSRRYWVDSRMRDGWQQVQDELSAADRPYGYDSVRRELTRQLAACHAGLSNAVDDRMPDGSHYAPDETDWRRYEERDPYAEELKALSLPELIDRYARTWHRAANQPSNAELAEQCSMIKQLIGRQLEGWVPQEEVESWVSR